MLVVCQWRAHDLLRDSPIVSVTNRKFYIVLFQQFNILSVDFKRYSVNNPGSVQRQSMAPPRMVNRGANSKQLQQEQAKELEQFFKDKAAVFQYPLKEIREGASRNNFRAWFEFLVKFLNRNYELPDTNNCINEEVCLNTHI